MSVSMFIRAIKPANEKHHQMMNIYCLCKKSGVSIPPEVSEYFGETEPKELGVVIDHYDLPEACRQKLDGGDCYQIDLSTLPKDVRYLEVYLD